MSLPVIRRVSDKKYVDLDKLSHLADEFLIPEILRQTTEWGMDENRAQARLNPPNMASSIRLDNRRNFDLRPAESKRLSQAQIIEFPGMKRSLTFYYVDLAILAKATVYAWRALMELTARASGHTRGTYYAWTSDPSNQSRSMRHETISSVVRWIKASSSPDIRIAILGPTNEDRRKRIYNPRGKKQQSKWMGHAALFSDTAVSSAAPTRGKAIDRYRFLKPRKSRVGRVKTKDGPTSLYSQGKGTVIRATSSRRGGTTYHAGVAKAIQEIVQRRVRSSFRDIGCYYRFVPNRDRHEQREPTPYYGYFIPELALKLKRG